MYAIRSYYGLVGGKSGQAPAPPRPPAPFAELTPREREILECIADGMSNKMIARALDIVITSYSIHYTKLYEFAQTLPLMCQHCEHPPCVDVCPTGASFKRADGIVLVDKHTCIGCRYCVMACPFGARSFVHEPVTSYNFV